MITKGLVKIAEKMCKVVVQSGALSKSVIAVDDIFW
jgi:hypothetical protein